MTVIKSNTAPKRQLPVSETNPNKAKQRAPKQAPTPGAADGAARPANAALAAAQSGVVATATAGPALPPIEGADAAKAMAELVSSHVSQQPESAMRAQANARPEHVLSLLDD
jgi:hypothetical protein